VKERLIHWCSREAMDCEGVGPSLVNQLVDKGLVKDVGDLYSIERQDLLDLERIAEKTSSNIIDAIRGSVNADFDRVLFALGIRHVGRTTAQILAEKMGGMDRIRQATVEDLSRTEGVGQVVGKTIREFMDDPQNQKLIGKLRKAGLKMEMGKKPTGGPLEGKVFIFTGELESMPRAEAQALVKSLGGKIADSVSKSVDFVVAGREPGSKLEKARSMDKEVIDERQFLELVKKK